MTQLLRVQRQGMVGGGGGVPLATAVVLSHVCLTDRLFTVRNGEDGATRADTWPGDAPEGSAPRPVLRVTSSDV